MIAATTRAVIRSAKNSEDPVTALALTQDCLATDLSQAGSFATLFHARLRASDGRILFSDAGHGLTLVIRTDGTWERLSSEDMPVGLLPDSRWESFETRLNPGDMIVSFSDGVLDLYDGTLAAVDEIGKLGVSAASAKDLVDSVHRRAQGTSNPDDVTILAVRRDGQRPLTPRERTLV
jgi:serine phosphatase RsbU (regulator of sigma subunit)